MDEEEYAQFVDHTRGGLLVTSSTFPEDRYIERIGEKKNFLENKEKLRRFFLEYPLTVGKHAVLMSAGNGGEQHRTVW